MAKKILKVATFGLVGSKLLSKPSATPTAAAATPIMPTPDDAAVKSARRKAIAAQMQRGGRSSTMLTDNTDTLGG